MVMFHCELADASALLLPVQQLCSQTHLHKPAVPPCSTALKGCPPPLNPCTAMQPLANHGGKWVHTCEDHCTPATFAASVPAYAASAAHTADTRPVLNQQHICCIYNTGDSSAWQTYVSPCHLAVGLRQHVSEFWIRRVGAGDMVVIVNVGSILADCPWPMQDAPDVVSLALSWSAV